jgi:hypothetical protein
MRDLCGAWRSTRWDTFCARAPTTAPPSSGAATAPERSLATVARVATGARTHIHLPLLPRLSFAPIAHTLYTTHTHTTRP